MWWPGPYFEDASTILEEQAADTVVCLSYYRMFTLLTPISVVVAWPLFRGCLRDPRRASL